MGGEDLRNARLYLVGVGASTVGDSAMSLVAGIWVKALTGSSAAAAWVAVCIYGPSLLGPVGGLVADRVRRRRMLLAINLAGAAVMLPLLLVDSAADVWLIYVVMAAYGIAATLTDSAESALFAVMLPDDLRQRFNGLRLAFGEGGKLVAPLLGAGLYVVLGGGWVAALNAITFVFAALMIARLRVVEPPPQPAQRHWAAEVAAGFRHIWRDPALRAIVLAGAAAMLSSGLNAAAQYGLVDALRQPPAFLGVLVGALGAGSIVAGLVSGRLIARFGERRLALAGLVNGALGQVLQAIGTIPTALLGRFILGFALPWTLLAVINLTQRRTPPALQGRVAATVSLALFAPLPLTQAVSAVAIDYLSYSAIYLIVAALSLATAVWLYRSRH